MPAVTFTRKGKTVSLLCRVDDDAGNPTFQQTVNPNTKAGQRRLCNATGCGLSDLLQYIVQINDGGSVTFTVGQPTADPCEVLIRGIRQPRDAGRWIKAESPDELIRSVIAVADYPAAEPVLSVTGDTIVFLDIDYHTLPYDQRPTEAELNRLATLVRPAPLCGWATHGRGYKACYIAARGYTATELAGCAAVSWSGLDGRCTAEIKNESRHPSYLRGSQRCGPVSWSTPSDDLSAVGRWMSRTIDPEARDDYLAECGWRIGQKFDHSKCLIAPGASSHAEPVVVLDGGVHCHSCAAHGRAYPGQRKPGFVPWASLIGGIDSRLYLQAKHFVHWPHARHVLSVITGLPESILKPAYAAMLKMLHGTADPRIKAAFATLDVVRIDGRWVKPASQTFLPRDAKNIIGELPATWAVRRELDGSFSVAARKSVVEDFSIPSNDLREYGYYDLHPVRGLAVWAVHRKYAADKLAFLVASSDGPEAHRPRYLPVAERLSRPETLKLLSRTLEGVDFNVWRFYIIAKAFAEGAAGSPPMLFLAGPSGSGKSSYAHLAAATLGDKVTDVTYTANTERLWQQIGSASDGGSFCNVNEIFKLGQTFKLSPRQTVDFILNMTTDAVSHRLYLGPVANKRLPVLTLTDTAIALSLAEEGQLARRLYYYRLGRRVDWKASLSAAGIDHPKNLRHGSRELAHALDSFLSWTIDDYLSDDRTFDQIANELGVYLLESSQEFTHQREALREFAKHVCEAPPLSGAYKDRFKTRGFVLVLKDYPTHDVLSESWAELADDRGERWQESRRCSEASWDVVFGVPGTEVLMDVRPHRKNVLFIRFRVGPIDNPILVNGEIFAGLPPTTLDKLRITG